jgi:capsular polysaccharide biosynthesis protein
MELADLSRMLARYRWLVIVCVLFGQLAAAITHYGDAKTYTASARLVLDTADPESRAESSVFADTAKAIATSPPQVGQALAAAHITERDPVAVARRVSVRALGSSGIIQLSVRDENGQLSALIANALAAEVIQTREGVATGERERVLRDLDQRIIPLNRQIAALDTRIARLSLDAASTASPAAANAIRSRQRVAERQRDALAQQRSVVENERVSVLSSDALRPKASIISQASKPASTDSSGLLPDLVLGSLIGLILGLGLAGALELFRPTITGGSALARAFDAPLLGTLGESAEEAGPEAKGITSRLALVAAAHGVSTVNLLAVGRPVDLDAIARRLLTDVEEERALARTADGQVVADGRTTTVSGPEQGPRIASIDPSGLSLKPLGAPVRDKESNGLVVVSHQTLNKRDVAEATKLIQKTSLPLLGLIAVRSRRAAPETQGPKTAIDQRRTA